MSKPVSIKIDGRSEVDLVREVRALKARGRKFRLVGSNAALTTRRILKFVEDAERREHDARFSGAENSVYAEQRSRNLTDAEMAKELLS